MNDDIVAQLRTLGDTLLLGDFQRLAADTESAADEIERLRAEVEVLRRRVADREAEIVDRALGFTRDVSWDPKSSERIRCERYAAERGFTCFGLNGGPGMEMEP